jgi:hypothetical protein
MRVQCNLRDDIYLQFKVFRLSETHVLLEISEPQSISDKAPSLESIQDEASQISNTEEVPPKEGP